MFVRLCDSTCSNSFFITILCFLTRVERLEMCTLLKYCAFSFPVVLCGHCYNCLFSQRVCLIIHIYIPIAIWVVDIADFSVKLWRCLCLFLSLLMPISLVVSVRILYAHLWVHVSHIWARGNSRHVSFSCVQSYVQSVCSFDMESKGASTSSTLAEMVCHIC